MSDTNIFTGTFNTFNSRTGGTNSNVILQAGPNENLLLKGNIVGNGTFTNLIATNSTVTNLLASSGTISALTVGTLNGLITGLPTSVTIVQALHGFSVGNWLYLNGSVYTLADATSVNTAEVVGVVTQVINANTFILQDAGYVSGLSGLNAGTVYWLSTSSGSLTISQPTTIGVVNKPLIVADSATSGYFTNYRGELNINPPSTQTIGSLYITSSVVVASTTTALNASTGALVVTGGIGAIGLNVTSETTSSLFLTKGTATNLAVSNVLNVGTIFSSSPNFYWLNATSTGQTIGNITVTGLSSLWQTSSSAGTAITNSSAGIFTINNAGPYLFTYNYTWNGTAGGTERAAWISKTGNTSIRWAAARQPPFGGTGAAGRVELGNSTIINLAANDTLQLFCYQDSGGNLSQDFTDVISFGVFKIS